MLSTTMMLQTSLLAILVATQTFDPPYDPPAVGAMTKCTTAPDSPLVSTLYTAADDIQALGGGCTYYSDGIVSTRLISTDEIEVYARGNGSIVSTPCADFADAVRELAVLCHEEFDGVKRSAGSQRTEYNTELFSQVVPGRA